MDSFSELESRNHEQVSFFQDQQAGLLGIIAVHSTAIGPGLGGCRFKDYPDLNSAVTDVLKLSEAMSYKNSLCGINFGGAKSVIVKNAWKSGDRKKLFEQFGHCVQAVNGKYITAEDIGTTVADISTVGSITKFVAGTDPKKGGGGEPAPFTALGVFEGLKACLERVYGSPDFKAKHIAIQGAGQVGYRLGEMLVKAGARVTVADPNENTVRACKEAFGAAVVAVDEIVNIDCDVFSPNAVGGTVNEKTAATMKAKIVAGAANNQIFDGRAGNNGMSPTEQVLRSRGILYAPDFAINAGGVILCADEFEPGGFTEKRVTERVLRIYSTVAKILDESKSSGELPGSVALKHAKERIQKADEKRRSERSPFQI